MSWVLPLSPGTAHDFRSRRLAGRPSRLPLSTLRLRPSPTLPTTVGLLLELTTTPSGDTVTPSQKRGRTVGFVGGYYPTVLLSLSLVGPEPEKYKSFNIVCVTPTPPPPLAAPKGTSTVLSRDTGAGDQVTPVHDLRPDALVRATGMREGSYPIIPRGIGGGPGQDWGHDDIGGWGALKVPESPSPLGTAGRGEPRPGARSRWGPLAADARLTSAGPRWSAGLEVGPGGARFAYPLGLPTPFTSPASPFYFPVSKLFHLPREKEAAGPSGVNVLFSLTPSAPALTFRLGRDPPPSRGQ